MGLLSKGEVLIKNPSDFRGNFLGDSEKNTRDILHAAEGNVLVIDEAYALTTSNTLSGSVDLYGTSVINTLVEQIQARPGDDRAVIMLGYRKEMEEMFKNANPGLARRFQLEQAYEFPDYDDVALLKILRKKAKESQLIIPVPVAKLAVRSLARARAKPNFGNAGAVDSLLCQAKERMQERGDGTSNTLSIVDFSLEDNSLDEEALNNLFTDMIGMDSITDKLSELKRVVQFSKARGEQPTESVSFNYLFLGNPGTGKTTIARCMGKMFKILGLIPDDKVYEYTPKDFVTGYVGQAGKQTMDILEKSRGGVLFIDEAYQLNPKRGGNFMTEVVDEICAKLTDTDFKGKMLVVLAGYDSDMDEMLSVNPGLKSRFSERLSFKDLSAEDTRDLINLKLSKKKIPLSPTDAESETLLSLSRVLAMSKDYANGRDVGTVCDRTYTELAKRSSHRDTSTNIEDVRRAINSLIFSRKSRKDGKTCSNTKIQEQFQDEFSIYSSPPPLNPAFKTDEKSSFDEDTIEEITKQGLEEDEKEEENLFLSLNPDFMKAMQNLVEEMGLNSKEGIEELLSSLDDTKIIQKLKLRLSIGEDEAKNHLNEWRNAHKELKRHKEKRNSNGMEAIWHCAVCKRGGHPQPVCYFAPYISGYRVISI